MSALKATFTTSRQQPTNVWEAIHEKYQRLAGLEKMIRGEQRVLTEALAMLGGDAVNLAAEWVS